ncbi:MAG: A/G-specific adenine glycosylase [Rhizobiaceae bacterium]|nr:A/G-specific adenine glycosylase [Rhizobiaceae bacterium]
MRRPTASRADLLLAWYDRHARVLPWRQPPGEAVADPYRVWLSEIMLQQTTVEAVKPYFRKFLERWPDVAALAAAGTDDVMKAWAGLGYYSRARNLKKCADAVASEHGGEFPGTFDELLKLPGIGRYTAAAIAAIAYGKPEPVVDGNVERVVSRLFAIATPLPQAKAEITEAVRKMLPAERPGDFAQAMMDLGATICTPRRPACLPCPLNEGCAALRDGDPEHYPVKPLKAERPARRGAAFVAVRTDGAVLLRKRPERGLLGGMAEVPTTAWTARSDGETGLDAAPFPADWHKAGSASHVFTHFSLELTVYRAEIDVMNAPKGHWWSTRDDLLGEALPTVMKKVIEAAIPGATRRDPRSKS